MNRSFLKKSVICIFTITFILVSITLPVGSSENEFSYQANNIDDSTIEIIVNIPSYDFDRVYAGNDFYATVDLEYAGVSVALGGAKLPVISRMIEIPYGANPVADAANVIGLSVYLEAISLLHTIAAAAPSSGAQNSSNLRG